MCLEKRAELGVACHRGSVSPWAAVLLRHATADHEGRRTTFRSKQLRVSGAGRGWTALRRDQNWSQQRGGGAQCDGPGIGLGEPVSTQTVP